MPRLIENWQRAWRLTSVRAAALLVVFSLLQTDVVPLLQAIIPPKAFAWCTALIGLAIGVLRILAQPGVLTPPAPTALPVQSPGKDAQP